MFRKLFFETKEYEKKNVKLILGDSREIIREFPDSCFDAIITDPPYGVEFDGYDRRGAEEVFFELEEEFFRVLKKSGWLVFWWPTKKLPDVAKLKLFQYRWMLIAEMKGSVGKCAVGDRHYSPLLVFSKGNAKVRSRCSDILPARELPQIEGLRIKQRDFKPTYTQSLLISMFAGKNGKILDPFAGFGSLLLASLLTGMGEVVGIEKDEERFDVARRILEEETISASIPELLEAKSRDRSVLLFREER